MKKEKDIQVIITRDGRYRLYDYQNEIELERMIVEHSKEIFGKNTYYFDIKKKITGKSGFGTIPDGYVIDFDRKKIYVLEVELIKHDLKKHIIPQIMSFKIALDNKNSREELVEIFADELKSSKNITKEELSKIVDNYGIIILIDDIGNPVEGISPLLEFVDYLAKNSEVKVIPFQTYIKGNSFSQDHLHSFKSFTKEELEKESKKWTFKWETVPVEKHMSKLRGNSEKIFEELRKKICMISSDIKEVHRANWTTFQISKLGNFCTIKFPKGNIEIYLKVNKNFKDSKKITQNIQRTPAWTFDKVFTIKSQKEIDYAIYLIEQAYRCVCNLKSKRG